jgi:hypothetical protein
MKDESDWKPPEGEELIVCAALLHKESGRIMLGVRHYCPRMREQINASEGVDFWKGAGIEQGFVDQYGRFLNREDAHKIAKEKNQIRRRCGGDDETLYSENLY